MKPSTLTPGVHEEARVVLASQPLKLHLIGFCPESGKLLPGEPVQETIPVLAWSLVGGRVYPHMGEPLDATIARFEERTVAVVVQAAVEIDDMVFPYNHRDGHFDGRMFASTSGWLDSFQGSTTGLLTMKEWKDAVKAFRTDEAMRARMDAIEGVVTIPARQPVEVPAAPSPPPEAPLDPGRKPLAPPVPEVETPEEIAAARAAMEQLRAAGIVSGTAAPAVVEEDEVDASSLV